MPSVIAHTLVRDVPLEVPIATPWLWCQGAFFLNIQVATDATGAATGTWTILESDDPNAEFDSDSDPLNSIAVYVDITADLRVDHIQGDGNVLGEGVWAFQISQPGRFIRLVYTPVSGGVGTKCNIFVYGVAHA